MSVLSRRGPYANQPAKLPGIQAERITDGPTREAVAALREWVEVRLGARGDKFERAVTERDLNPRIDGLRSEVMGRIKAIEDAMTLAARGEATAAPAPAQAAGIPASVAARLNELENSVALLQQQLAVVLARLDETPEPTESLTLLPAQSTPSAPLLLSVGPDL